MTHTTFIQVIKPPLNRKRVTTVFRQEMAATRTATIAHRSRPFIINCSDDYLPKQRIEIR